MRSIEARERLGLQRELLRGARRLIGVRPVTGRVLRLSTRSPMKKCSLSRMIGPPSEKPVCERLNGCPRTAGVSAP